MIERAVTLALGDRITLDDFAGPSRSVGAAPVPGGPARPRIGPGFDLDGYLGGIERALLLEALEASGGNRTEAAKLLGTTFRSFRYRLAKYGLGDDEES